MRIIIIVFIAISISSCSETDKNNFIFEHKEFIDKNKAMPILYYFFSSIDCHECIEGGEILNELTDSFNIIGVIGERENSKLDLYNKKFEFPIVIKKGSLKNIEPFLAPSIVGVLESGTVCFNIPYIDNLRENLKIILYSASLKISHEI